MNCDLDQIDSGWDRTFFRLSSDLAEPLCLAFRYLRYRMVAPLDPKLFENRDSLAQEIALRGLLGLGAFFTLLAAPVTLSSAALLGIGHKLLRQAGYFFQSNGYTHVRGSAPEKSFAPGDSPIIYTGNHCGAGGGVPLEKGGVIDWRYRIDDIVAGIKEEDADVVVLQEYYDSAFAEALIAHLQDRYAHIFFHLGQNLIGSESGVMILSKIPVHKFSFSTFQNNNWTLSRGFAFVEFKRTPDAKEPFFRLLGTHLRHGEEASDRTIRLGQVAQMTESIRQAQAKIPTLLAGDLNIERDGEEGKVLSDFRHGYQGVEPTCTNHLVAKWDQQARGTWGEMIDYISLYIDETSEKIELADCHLVPAFDDTYNTKKARSDHHSIVLTVKGL